MEQKRKNRLKSKKIPKSNQKVNLERKGKKKRKHKNGTK
jgi:hypothetical protein